MDLYGRPFVRAANSEPCSRLSATQGTASDSARPATARSKSFCSELASYYASGSPTISRSGDLQPNSDATLSRLHPSETRPQYRSVDKELLFHLPLADGGLGQTRTDRTCKPATQWAQQECCASHNPVPLKASEVSTRDQAKQRSSDEAAAAIGSPGQCGSPVHEAFVVDVNGTVCQMARRCRRFSRSLSVKHDQPISLDVARS